MKYGDFSSLVQLGVGLHVGTALLQLYGDLGEAPLIRKLARIRTLLSSDGQTSSIGEALNGLEADYEIFKVQFFNEYKKYIKINASVAALLILFLAAISFMNDELVPVLISVLFTYCSVVPALTTLLFLWVDAERAIKPLKDKADEIEKRALTGK